MGVLVASDDDLSRPTDDVGVGHDAFAFDDESRTACLPHGIEPPGHVREGRLGESEDLNNGTFWIRSSNDACQRQSEQENTTLCKSHPQKMGVTLHWVKLQMRRYYPRDELIFDGRPLCPESMKSSNRGSHLEINLLMNAGEDSHLHECGNHPKWFLIHFGGEFFHGDLGSDEDFGAWFH
jgi:hypothetical protein